MVPPPVTRQNNLIDSSSAGTGNTAHAAKVTRFTTHDSVTMPCSRPARLPPGSPGKPWCYSVDVAMTPIKSTLNPYTQTPVINTPRPATPAPDSAQGAANPQSAADTPRIEISQKGRELSASRSSQADKAKSNDDIDDSGLPDTIKGMLKQLRELNEQLAAQKEQLQAAMARQDLPPEERQARMAQAQGTISTLTAALSSVMNALNKQMSEQDLSNEQRAKVASLIAKYAS